MNDRNKTVAALASEARAFDRLEPVIHERTRLAIVSMLAVNKSLTFVELRDGLKLTDGNLAAHLRTLTKAGFIRIRKTGQGSASLSTISISPAGRSAFTRYIEGLAGLVKRHR